MLTEAAVLFFFLVVKGKGKGLDTCYSATYMIQTRDQQRFTISEVAADWHEHYVAIHFPRQRTIGPTVQLADIPSPQSGLHPVATHFPSR